MIRKCLMFIIVCAASFLFLTACGRQESGTENASADAVRGYDTYLTWMDRE